MRFVVLIVCALTFIACGQAPAPESTHPVAVLVLTNGNVVTVDERNPAAEAIAAIDDRIVAVGRSAEIAVFIGDATDRTKIGGFPKRAKKNGPANYRPVLFDT